MPLVENGTSYHYACKLGVKLKMTSWVEEWERKTFLVKHTVECNEGRVALEGFERRVMVVEDPESERGISAIQIPEEVRKRFA